MSVRCSSLALAVSLACAAPASAQVVLADRDSRQLTASGYLQTQFERIAPDDAAARDRVFFRRLVLGLKADVTDRWAAALQVDLAPATDGDHVVVKDAWLRYAGWQSRGLTVTLGNQKLPFSRSILTSSSRRQLIERGFAGDRDYGALGRALALKVDGEHRGRRHQWSTAAASNLQEPDATVLRVDGIVEAADGGNEGLTAAARYEWHPLGGTPMEQGAFERATRIVLGVAGFTWHTDGDTAPPAGGNGGAADAMHGAELSAGVRSGRWSADAEYQRLTAASRTPRLEGGLYRNGRARLHKATVEAGWMLVPRRVELAAMLDALASGTFDEPWRRFAVGASYYVQRHRLKFQVLHRWSRHDGGRANRRSRALSVLAQAGF